MTLYRQLLTFTLCLFLLLLAGVWVEKLQSTRGFLIDQLESHAQDTATSLGLSLSPVIAENDIPTAETMINAVFDRGYYKTIRFEDMEGNEIFERVLRVKSAGVPGWFVRLVPIETPAAESLVMAGWNQAGRLYVKSHPGYAYGTLWHTAIQISSYFLLVGAAVLLAGALILKMMLRPLNQVEKQAEALCRREYQIVEHIPKTRELRRVVETMNRMTSKVRDMFAEQAQLAERLRSNAYSDQLTGLGNRRYMNGQVEAGLNIDEGVVKGALLIIEVNDLQEINETQGFAAGDELLQKVAERLRRGTKTLRNAALGRLTGGNFAVFMPEVNPDDANEIAGRLSEEMARLAIEGAGCSENIAGIGGVTYAAPPTASQLFAEADVALRSAQRQGPNKYQVNMMAAEEGAIVKGRSWWKDTLEQVLQTKAILLYSQNVVGSEHRENILHTELLSRISLAPGEVVSAGVFVPLAERLQMISRLDRVVLEKVFAIKKEQLPVNRIAVNLSPSSLNDPRFLQWAMESIAGLPDDSARIIFEFAEYSTVLNLDAVRKFSAEVRRQGHGIGLDHFGQSFSNFGYLKSLQPEYVKIDRAYTGELKHAYGDSHFFVGALSSVAHSLDIRVIAEGVETEEEADIFRELNVDAVQGHLISEPHLL